MYILKEIEPYFFELYSVSRNGDCKYVEIYPVFEMFDKEKKYFQIQFFPFTPINMRAVIYEDIEEIHFIDGSFLVSNCYKANFLMALLEHYGIQYSEDSINEDFGPFYLFLCNKWGRKPVYYYFNYTDLLNDNIRAYSQESLDGVYRELQYYAQNELILPKEFFDLSLSDDERYSITIKCLSKTRIWKKINIRKGIKKYKPIKYMYSYGK